MIRSLVCLAVCLGVVACGTPRLRCEGPLQPINAPQPKAAAVPTSKEQAP